jgi:acyl carrier protein
MLKNERVEKIVFDVIDETNEELSDSEKIGTSVDTILFGENGALDSIGLVNFIVEVEQKIGEVFETSVLIADEKAVSQKNSPFRTIGTLVDYLTLLLEKKI